MKRVAIASLAALVLLSSTTGCGVVAQRVAVVRTLFVCALYSTADEAKAAIVACNSLIRRYGEFSKTGNYAMLYRARAYEALGRDAEAVHDLRLLRFFDPKNPLIKKFLAVGLNDQCWAKMAKNGDAAKALPLCDESLSLDPGNPATLNSRGYAYYRKKNYPKALADIDASLVGHPDFADSLYIRGLIERDSGHAAKARKDIASAVAITPNIAKVGLP